MRFWWVNQNQTFRQEVTGGYVWSPKRNANGRRNPFYEFMREVAPGDLILSFSDTRIRRIGIAQSYAYECPKPAEFGSAGPNWERIGWRIDVRYVDPQNEIRPADHMGVLRPHLPEQYSPLQQDGRGLQSVYLTEVPSNLMNAIAQLVGPVLQNLIRIPLGEIATDAGKGFWEWEEHLEEDLRADAKIEKTEREQLVMARRGQGRFKQNVRMVERRCRITQVDRLEHLRASHIKPWRNSSNEERLNGENGLLLTPTIDHLFDRGFISFENNGRLLVSPAAHPASLIKMGLSDSDRINVGRFSAAQCENLEFHRDQVFLRAQTRPRQKNG
jgi:putative restriction endonuclease